jgi:hypothetical protein
MEEVRARAVIRLKLKSALSFLLIFTGFVDLGVVCVLLYGPVPGQHQGSPPA